MDFDTWWNNQDSGAPTQVFDTDKQMAQAAWNAAIQSEPLIIKGACSGIVDKTVAELWPTKAAPPQEPVGLDYKGLMAKAEELAKVQAALLYPPSHRQDEEVKRLTQKYYQQYTYLPSNPTAQVSDMNIVILAMSEQIAKLEADNLYLRQSGTPIIEATIQYQAMQIAKLQSAARMALDAMQWDVGGEPLPSKELEAITALREALKEQR